MAEETSDERPCRYCQEPIRNSAKVCYHCSSDQRGFLHHLPPVGVLVSIGLLVLSTWQFIEARDALGQAREAREATEALALSSAEIILATLAVDKGRFMDAKPKALTTTYVRRRVGSVFDALGLSQKERSRHLRVYRAYLDWEQTPEKSPARQQALQQLERFLREDAAL